MSIIQDVLLFLANNIFQEVAILIGVITLIGLWVQKKPVRDVVAGTLRAAIGIYVLFAGVDLFVEQLASFQEVVASAVGAQPPAAARTLGDFLAQQGGTVALVIATAFILHLLLVLFLRTRYVYLTGHLMFWISVVAVASLVEMFGALPQGTLVVSGAIIVALYWTIQPLFIAPLMRKVIGSDNWGYGHTSSAACAIAALIAPAFGSQEEHGTERLELPKWLGFFKDVNVSTALIIAIIMLIAMIFASPDVLAEQAAQYSEDLSPWVWGFVAAFRFAAGIAILLYGVRMFLGEIVPAFQGISEKVIPNSRPALDVPTVFPFATTAVMIGFVSSTIVFLILMGIFAAIGWFVLVPPMIMLFFPGGGAGVFGNRFGGWRGAVIGGAVNGIFLAFGQAIFWGLLSQSAPELATLADPDWYLLSGVIMLINQPFAALDPAVGIWIVTAIIIVLAGIWLWYLKRSVSMPEEELADEPLSASQAESEGNTEKEEEESSL